MMKIFVLLCFSIAAITSVVMVFRAIWQQKPAQTHVMVLLVDGEWRDILCDNWQIDDHDDLVIYYKNYMSVYARGRYLEVHEKP